MPKRFTEVDKWKDSFFRELSPDAKLAFFYMCDNADCVGVWDPDYRLASFCIKKDMDWDSILDELGNRVRRLRNGKIWLTRFVAFQYGELTSVCKPHVKYLETLKRHGIDLDDCYHNWSEGAPDGFAGNGAAPPAQELPLKERNARTRDMIFEALAELQGTDIARLTVQERGRLNKAAASIREVEPTVTPDRIKAAAKVWKGKGYSAPASAVTIASHWSELTPPPLPADISDKLTLLDARLTELSQPAPDGSSRVPRADITATERAEYHRLLGERIALKKKSG